jgi:hypothetical protein
MKHLSPLWRSPHPRSTRPIRNSARSALSPRLGHTPYPRGDVKDYLCAARPDFLQFLVQIKVIAGFGRFAQFVYALLHYRCDENKLAKSFEVDPLQMQAFRILKRRLAPGSHCRKLDNRTG